MQCYKNSATRENELYAWLKLSFLPRIGSARLKNLSKKDSLTNIINYSIEQLYALGFSTEQVNMWHKVDRMVEKCLHWQSMADNHHIIILTDNFYPYLLKEIVSAPPVLFVKGNLPCLLEPQIAIVGSRYASLEGKNNARDFAKNIVQQHLLVTSGLALGIDGHAHESALQAKGKTIAVLGSGVDVIYPSKHKNLAQRIIENGALVSEFMPDVQPKSTNFPRRNRIISGLSLGVLVIEAAPKSGSLITARYALEQGREIFVVPKSLNTINSGGGNELIRKGACLVQNVGDIIAEIHSLFSIVNSNNILNYVDNKKEQTKQTINAQANMHLERKEMLLSYPLLEYFKADPITVDILAIKANIPVQEIITQLIQLELLGYIINVSNGYVLKNEK